MLTSIVLQLDSPGTTTLPAHLGRASYSAVLNQIRTVAPTAATEIHDLEGIKPLTCSALLGEYPRRRGMAHIAPGGDYWLRITGLTETISQLLFEAFLARRPTTWTLHGHTFTVRDALCDPAIHPWSGSSSYEAIASTWLLGSTPLAQMKKVDLAFLSPTAFRTSSPYARDGMNVTLPLPRFVFGGLADRWNRFSPVELPHELRDFGDEVVAVSRFQISSVLVEQKDEGSGRGARGRERRATMRTGAVGDVTYTALHGDRYWLSMFQMLADFALFSGVGVQTTTGMGQVRRR